MYWLACTIDWTRLHSNWDTGAKLATLNSNRSYDFSFLVCLHCSQSFSTYLARTLKTLPKPQQAWSKRYGKLRRFETEPNAQRKTAMPDNACDNFQIMRDRRKHREALMENFDKTYTNFERDNVPFRVPNMDFMVEQVFKLPRGGENEEGERFRHRPTDNYGKVLHPQDSQWFSQNIWNVCHCKNVLPDASTEVDPLRLRVYPSSFRLDEQIFRVYAARRKLLRWVQDPVLATCQNTGFAFAAMTAVCYTRALHHLCQARLSGNKLFIRWYRALSNCVVSFDCSFSIKFAQHEILTALLSRL